MSTDGIRETFVRFFEERGHLRLASAPLVVHGDPSVLLTSAGMQPFKAYYVNPSLAPSRRLVTVQRCMRARGVDDDTSEVGDNTHHTFFEMLGNFAFGSTEEGGYFKKEAIAFGYELVTQGYGVDPGKVWATYWAGEPGIPRDNEAADLWRAHGLPEAHIVPLNKKPGGRENFWGPTGDSGPCGPCSEIHIDVLGKCPKGLSDGECSPDPFHECGRFVEIWNLVFNQFFMEKDKTLRPLQFTGVDTGSGLERVAALMNGVASAYETDLFAPIIQAIEGSLDVSYRQGEDSARPIRIIADHARAVTFMLADGVTPSNEGRGYVARRLLRRAVRYGRQLGGRSAFMKDVVSAAIDRYAPRYPHLGERRAMIERAVAQEEARFSETLTAGLERINAEVARLESAGQRVLPGAVAFQLYDTFGFPFELTVEVAEGRGYEVDEAGFREQLAEQRRRAREGAQFRDTIGVEIPEVRVEFAGYDTLEVEGANVLFLAQGGERVGTASAGDDELIAVLDRTPFYAERGGQVGDRGELRTDGGGRIEVTNTRPGPGDSIVHVGRVVEGSVAEGARVTAIVAESDRRRTMRHHTATHLLHAALRQVLGPEAHQAGSLVSPTRLRFDFSYGEALGADQRRSIEALVNEVIRRNLPVETQVLSLDDAMKSGAVALFDEKYGDKVRVLAIGDFSKELCGGTHVTQTGEIGSFVMLGESSVGSGMRRIEALAGDAAERYVTQQLETLEAARAAGTARDELPQRVAQLVSELTETRRRAESAERKTAQHGLAGLLEQAAPADGYRVIAAQLDFETAPTIERLREAADWLRDKLGGPSAIVLASVADGRPQLLATVSSELVKRGLQAGKLLNEVGQETGGRGGGRPEMAQGGGGDPAKLGAGLERAKRLALSAN